MINIYVGNLPFKVTETELLELFESYGKVNSVQIITDRFTRKPRGFGFVEMENDSEGEAAIEALDGSVLNGRSLRVNQAKPRESGGGRGSGQRHGR